MTWGFVEFYSDSEGGETGNDAHHFRLDSFSGDK